MPPWGESLEKSSYVSWTISPMVDRVFETFLGERLTSIFFEAYVSSQTAWARWIGPGLIARMIDSASSSSLRGKSVMASLRSWERFRQSCAFPYS